MPDEIFESDPERIDVLWASPSCTQHSRASGGKKPRSNQLRCQPEYLLPYLRLTKCRRMFVENVTELLKWGPVLDVDITYRGRRYRAGQPDPRKEGLFFNHWYREIKISGYDVDIQVLNAADYGAATSRERLIVQAVRRSSGEKITWPEQTHSRTPSLYGYKPWRAASEIIDWSIPGKSIFGRKKPLCPNTLRRIEAGIRKYWGAWAEPFLIVLRGTGDDQIPSTAMQLTAPLPTLTAGGGHIALVRPYIIRYNGGDDRIHGMDAPLPTIDTRNRYGVVTPLVIPQQSAGTAKPDAVPLPTIATGGAIGVVEPFLTQYYGTSGPAHVDAPVPTIPTKDRFAVVQGRCLTMPDGQRYRLDITHRMLTMRELADATSFPHDYRFCGDDTAAKKQVGNAVPPALAEALYRAVLAA
jgi:DNA (cytosine-5)-methyltransferase 1